jgi:hypothetical protein
MSPLPSKPSADVLNGIKIIILSGALAGTIATWGWISSNSLKSVKANTDQQPTVPPAEENQFVVVIPPIADVVTLDASSATVPVVQTTPAPDLRTVSALPTQSASSSGPQIKTVVIGVQTGGGGGGGGKGSKPATSTKAS